MADTNKIIRQIQIEKDEAPYDLGGSIYKLDEATTAISNNDEVECLIFYCGTSSELV
jgi:hypothetical protein